MTIAYLGLGANLGDPIQQLIDARQCLSRLVGVQQTRSSAFYVSSPVGYAEQNDFVNCVIELQGDLEARSLFLAMQDIERNLGRVRNPKNQNAARVIDIDLLLIGEQQIDDSDLVVPHPRLHQRLFVLQPLAELNRELTIDAHGSVEEILREGDFSGQKIMKLGG